MSSSSFEATTREERAYYDGLDIDDLHALMHERSFGRTGAFWESLRTRTTLLASAWVLLEFLEHRSINCSARTAAAGVLLQLADSHDWSAESLADDADPEFDLRLRDVRRMVNQRIRALTR